MSPNRFIDISIEQYFLLASEAKIPVASALDKLLSDDSAKQFLFGKGKGLPTGRLLSGLKSRSEVEELSEYLYIAFLVSSFLRLTTLNANQIRRILDCQYVLLRFQTFHAQSERRVIIHLILSYQQHQKKRNGKDFAQDSSRDLAYTRSLLKRLLPLKELDNLAPFYASSFHSIILKSENPRVLLFDNAIALEMKEAVSSYLKVMREDGYLFYCLNQDMRLPSMGDIAISFLEKEVIISAYGITYSIIPPSNSGRRAKA